MLLKANLVIMMRIIIIITCLMGAKEIVQVYKLHHFLQYCYLALFRLCIDHL